MKAVPELCENLNLGIFNNVNKSQWTSQFPPGFIHFSFPVEAGQLQRNASTGARFLEDGLVVTGRYAAFSNNKKMATILQRELEHKIENNYEVGGHADEDQKQYFQPE